MAFVKVLRSIVDAELLEGLREGVECISCFCSDRIYNGVTKKFLDAVVVKLLSGHEYMLYVDAVVGLSGYDSYVIKSKRNFDVDEGVERELRLGVEWRKILEIGFMVRFDGFDAAEGLERAIYSDEIGCSWQVPDGSDFAIIEYGLYIRNYIGDLICIKVGDRLQPLSMQLIFEYGVDRAEYSSGNDGRFVPISVSG